MNENVKITLTRYPTEEDWFEAKRRALITVGKKVKTPPDRAWKEAMLRARHSPIRDLRFSFDFENLPSWISVHLVRHVHAQPYVKSQRNDRQQDYDRTKAPQDAPVDMIWDMNAEEWLTICNKRLCKQASPDTRDIIEKCAALVKEVCPEFSEEMVPMCLRQGGVCHEMFPCYLKDEHHG